MKDHLYSKDLYEPIKGDVAKLEKTLDKDCKKKKKTALAIIYQCLDPSIYNQISKNNDLHTLWKNLENIYKKKK